METSFWVWHRAKPVTQEEVTALRSAQVETLYWHVGELAVRDGTWNWAQPPLPLPVVRGFRVVPVVRLDPAGRAPLAQAAPLLLAQHFAELEIDYDCPDRRLAEYAQLLHQVREKIPRLTITALVGWIGQPAFREVAAAVTEVAPMFYDLEPDPVREKIPQPLPLLDPEKVTAQLQHWSRCPVPWRAGLPNFARVTIYDTSGKSRGHLRSWHWDDLCFDRSLAVSAPTSLGTTLLRVVADHQFAATALRKEEWLAARWPERAALVRAVAEAEKQGARGVTFFRLPDETAAGGWSLPTLANLGRAETPQLVLRQTTGQNLCLTNSSTIDLEPRLEEAERGYALELDAPAPLWREASAGDFWRLLAHADPDAAQPVAVAVPLARRLTFWFSQLRAGESLRTGLLQLAPAASIASLRYRILPGDNAWRKIE